MTPSRKPRLTSASVANAETRWAAIDTFLQSTPTMKPLRITLATLLDHVRKLADYGLAEEIEEAGTELRSEMIDRVVVWAFELGRLAGRLETS